MLRRLALVARILFYGSTALVVLAMLTLVITAQPRVSSEPELIDPAVRANVEAHVIALGSTPHNRAHPEAYAAAQAYIRAALLYQGYSVRVDELGNVLAHRGGNDPVVLGAHYDSAYSAPGADDNSSGVAAMLEVARLVAHEPGAVAFHAYANEEPPCFKTDCMGSLHAAADARAAGLAPQAIIVLDAVGFYSDAEASQAWPIGLPGLPSRGNFVAIVGDFAARRDVARLDELLVATSPVPVSAAVVPSFLAGADWSDHWSWRQAGYRAVMVTDTATFRNPHYHEGNDVPATIDFDRLAGLTQALAHAVRVLAAP